jgi:hypothetical protein
VIEFARESESENENDNESKGEQWFENEIEI